MSVRLFNTNDTERITFVRGAGSTVWDADGNAYLDMLSGTWCNVLGYGHPKWLSAVREQVSSLTHVGAAFYSREVDEALTKLRDVLPRDLTRVVLLNTGSEAVELALKMAHIATGAGELVVFEKGYYGATVYVLGLSEAGRTAESLPQPERVCRLPAPTCRRCPMGRAWPCDDFPCLADLQPPADKGEGRIAAVIYEPVMTAAGVLVPPPGYGLRLRELTSRCGALLVAEEVTTGMGRTGRWFGFQHEGIVPDILVLGKALGAGLPVSAVVTTGDVEERCVGALRHIQSHQNDPLSGRVAATVISIMQGERLVEQAARRGQSLLEGLRKLQGRGLGISQVRGKGLLLGIELEQDRVAEGVTKRQQLLETGVIVDYQPHTGTFRLFPPYVVTSAEIDKFLQVFEHVMKE